MRTSSNLSKERAKQCTEKLFKLKALLKFDSDEWKEKKRYQLEKEGERILSEIKEFEENKRDQSIFLLKRRQKWMNKYSKLRTMYTDHRSSIEWFYIEDQSMTRKLGIDHHIPNHYKNRIKAMGEFYRNLQSVSNEIPNSYITSEEIEKCLTLCEKVNKYRREYENEMSKMKSIQFLMNETMETMTEWIQEAEMELSTQSK